MKIAIVYSSKTGNTKELVDILYKYFLLQEVNIHLNKVEDFPVSSFLHFDGVIVGTYTWGDGDIPAEMLPLYRAFENQNVKPMITGVIGTGDSFYPHFCGAVDKFRDMLYFQSNLAVTLKVELSPQSSDRVKCQKFVQLYLNRFAKK